VKEAFSALSKDAKSARMYAGSDNADTQVARGRFRNIFLSGFREALEESPVLMIDVTPDGFFLGDVLVLESTERRGDVAEQLFSEGLRTVSVESGASDDELLMMAKLLFTSWSSQLHDAPDLASAAWEADFAHIYLEVVESLSDRDPEEVGESPIVRELAGHVAELNARASESEDGNLARIRQDELAVLLRLRDQFSFHGRADPAEGIRLEGAVSVALAEEVRAAIADRDMVRADVAGLLTACLEAVEDAEKAKVIGAALYAYLVNAMLAEGGAATLVQRTAELLDADLTPHLAHREQVRDAAASLAVEPTRGRLSRLFHEADPKLSTGLAFTLFQLLPGEDEAISIAPVLPVWALRVLADTVLLRAAPEPLVAIDVAKRFMASPERGSLLLGLAMAARQNDPRLIESALLHVIHVADDVREAAFVALRKHQTPKLRDAVRHALNDDSEGVRLEALRYCVAYRDLEVVPWLEARIVGPAITALRDHEVRALCIALGRINGVNAQPLLVELADGAREARHADLPRLALHGLKAIDTESARSAIQRVGRLVPALTDECQTLLGGAQ